MPPGKAIKDRPTISPSKLGKYIELDTCPRFFKYHIQKEGLGQIGHDKENFAEAFHGGNIIERQSGDEFEDNVVDIIQDQVSTFYNFESITLEMAAQAMPSRTIDLLPTPSSELSQEDITSGDFTYFGIQADELLLTEKDEFPEQVLEASNNDSLPFNKETLKNGFYQLHVEYTQKLFGEILQTLSTDSSIEEIGTSAPRVETQRDTPITEDNRQMNDPIVIFQPTLTTDIGVWEISGAADVVLVWPSDKDDKTGRIRVIDVKLSTEEKASHQIQTVTYSKAIEQLPTIASNDFTFETGVLTQEKEYLPLTPSTTPQFDRESRETDLKRLTRSSGVLDTVFHEDYSETSYQLDSKCSSCMYNEICYTVAIEEPGLELLGIDRGMQQTFENHGIQDLNDLADLAHPVDGGCNPKTDDKPRKTREHEDTYNALAAIPGLGERLPKLIQEAQALLQTLNPDHNRVTPTRNAPHITNTGYGSLPTQGNYSEDRSYKHGSMIRVYINVQEDHIRDSIAGLGFHITATATTVEPVSYAVLDSEMPDDPIKAHNEESQLLQEFSTELFDAIQKVADGISFDDTEHQDDPFLHFFTYTEQEKQLLQEQLALYTADNIPITKPTYSNLTEGNALQEDQLEDSLIRSIKTDASSDLHALNDLLSYREGVNQEMITAVAPDIESRIALRTPTTGLINIQNEFYPSSNKEEAFKRSDWTYTPDDSSKLHGNRSEIDLTNVFNYRFFNNSIKYSRTEDSIKLLHDWNSEEDSDGWYNSRVRTGAQLPMPYLWAAGGKITDEWVKKVKGDNDRPVINPYRYHDISDKSKKITTEDVEALLMRLCECLRHVEQGISKRKYITDDLGSEEE